MDTNAEDNEKQEVTETEQLCSEMAENFDPRASRAHYMTFMLQLQTGTPIYHIK